MNLEEDRPVSRMTEWRRRQRAEQQAQQAQQHEQHGQRQAQTLASQIEQLRAAASSPEDLARLAEMEDLESRRKAGFALFRQACARAGGGDFALDRDAGTVGWASGRNDGRVDALHPARKLPPPEPESKT